MIKEIGFKNYKAFNEGVLEIKPITILIGANSVGKSSILQLLLMLQQTALSQNYKSTLRLHGEFAGLGENENIFKDKDATKDIVLSFRFQDKQLFSLLKGEMLEELTHSIIRPLSYLTNFYYHTTQEKSINIKLSQKSKRVLRKDIWESREDFIDAINEIEQLKNEIKKISLKSKNDKEKILVNDIDFLIKSTSNFDKFLAGDIDYGTLYDFIKSLNGIVNDEFKLEFNITNFKCEKEDSLKTTRICLSNNDQIILELLFELDSKKSCYLDFDIRSDFFQGNLKTNTVKEELLKNISFDSTLFSLFKKDVVVNYPYEQDELTLVNNVIVRILSKAINNVKRDFSRELINYVSPLRAHPKRYYFLDKANINTTLDTLDGDSLTEILKENHIVKNKVNKWLKNFNLAVDVSTLQDVIHKLKIKQNGLNLDITDVGFGISQVLPVIVQGFLSFSNSLTIIEQPEIHLHPKMQADLADLFIDIIHSDSPEQTSKYLLIETHSEYLLKRLRRRISEGDKISANDVAIYFIHPKDGRNTGIIERKEITSHGEFDWPKDFYAGELLKDTIEFIKNQR